MKRPIAWMALVGLLMMGCSHRDRLAKVHLVDANGFNQTVTQRQRLDQLEKVNFLSNQAYQKVLRTWKEAATGQSKSILTSYYPSGQLMQYLEGKEGKAHGLYREWYENGKLRVQVTVTSGLLDFGAAAEQSWSFDGMSEAWSELGTLEAQIPYHKGKKEGVGKFYHANGKLWQQIPYKNGLIEGEFLSWYDTSKPFIKAYYVAGKPMGIAQRYWPDGSLQSEENYEKGKLLEARYLDAKGKLLGQVQKGAGQRVIFGKSAPIERQTLLDGEINGWVGYYDDEGILWHQLHVHKGKKEGEEIYFYPPQLTQEVEEAARGRLQPKISMQWHQDCLRGTVRTWYRNGQLQSERQIVQDQTDGPYLAYYPNGHVRIVEEYAQGKLVSGDYFEMHSMTPSSSVRDGCGKALIYNDLGVLEREVIYAEGCPLTH